MQKKELSASLGWPTTNSRDKKQNKIKDIRTYINNFVIIFVYVYCILIILYIYKYAINFINTNKTFQSLLILYQI